MMAPRPGTVGLCGIAAFSGLVGLEHVLRPDYDPRSRYVSEYAVGPYRHVMTTAFFALGIGSTATLVDLSRALPAPARSRSGLVFLGVWSGAILVAGLFPTDLSGPNGRPEHPTTPGTVHALAGITGFLSLPLAACLLGRRFRRDPAWRRFARPSLLLSALQSAAVVLSIASPVRYIGVNERVLIVCDLAWLAWLSQVLRHAPYQEQELT